jgi:peptidoglycan/LPS O-acetylase OafA/YrhL
MVQLGHWDQPVATLRPAPPSAGVAGHYRADIDGLRALAVLPVVLFHAGVRGFSGGFVGVDIFFVISGYLITGIVLRDVAQGRYSLAQFYRRRILRIFPVLGAVALATLLGTCLWLMPTEVGDYAQSLASAAVFASNIGFYATTDYFLAGHEARPLLHTWSLAVEEQWYLLWPLVLAWGAPRLALLRHLTFGFAVVCLMASMLLLPYDQPAVFYLLPFRGWELALGAIVAMRAHDGASPPTARLGAGLAGLGVVLIGVSVKAYTDMTPFPAGAAVVPCLGAALLIEAGRGVNPVSRALGWGPLRGLGLVSYSLYLWHWPVLVFGQSGLLLGHGVLAVAGMLVVCLVVAVLSWRFIEQPFRQGQGWSNRLVLSAGAGVLLAMLGLAAATPALARWLHPLSPSMQRTASYLTYDGDGAYRRGRCFKVGWRTDYDRAACMATTSKPIILFVGDSHAAQLWPGLARWRDRYDIVQATSTDCIARRYPDHKPAKCGAIVDYALHDWLINHHPARLVLASRWRLNWLDGVEATLRDPLVRASHPLLVGPVPQYDTALPRLLVQAHVRGQPQLPQSLLQAEPFAVDAVLRAMAARTGTPYVSLIDRLCTRQPNGQRSCRTMASGDVPLQFDQGHLTAQGSELVVDSLRPQLLGSTAQR